MSFSFPIVISEYTHLKFDFLGQTNCMESKNAITFVEGLLSSSEKAHLIFTEIVLCCSIVLDKGSGVLRHEQKMCSIRGLLDGEKFLEIMQCKPGLSLDTWANRVIRISGLPQARK